MPTTDRQSRTTLHKRTALKTALFYAVIACLWIYFSDRLLALFISDPNQLTHAQTLKGALYVVVTAGLLYLYLSLCLKSLRKQEEGLAEQQALVQQDVAHRFRQLNTLFNAINAVVYVADLETHDLLYVNQYTVEHFGPEWRGKKCFQYLQSDLDEPCAFCTNPQLVTGGEAGDTVTWEFQNLRNNRWYECFDKAIRWTNGRLARLEIALDVTERKEVENIKDEILSSISHEMRTPLTAITGFTELLLNEPEIAREHRQHVEIIYREAEKLTDLVNRFLDVRRLKSDRSRINYETLLVRDLLESIPGKARDCNKKHEILIDCQPDVMVYGNRKELTQVVIQLVDNACRYSPDGGEVSIRATRSAEEVMISVSDQGMGIPQHELGSIFEPFYRLDTGNSRSTRGVGLGLCVAREIVSLHGGKLTVASVPGQGSTFTLSFPPPAEEPLQSVASRSGVSQT